MTIQEHTRSNNILWLALLAGQLLVAFLFIFVTAEKEGGFMMPMKGASGMFFYLAGGVMLAAIFMSNFMYKKKKAEIPNLTSLDEKLGHHRATFILRAALIEGACLMALNLMFLENNLTFFILVATGILFFLQTRPSLEQFKNDYPLTNTERVELGM